VVAYQAPFRFNTLWLGAFLLVSSHVFAELKVTYGVPEGFSAAELDDSANYVGTFNGRTLPGFISYSSKAASLEFDAAKYAANGISPDDVDTIRSVISQLDYKRCSKGCNVLIAGYYVTVDKLKRSISIRDSREDYIAPETGFGLVNNQAIDLRAASDSYRAVNVNGNTYVGLPFQSFGYMSWYADRTPICRAATTHDVIHISAHATSRRSARSVSAAKYERKPGGVEQRQSHLLRTDVQDLARYDRGSR